MKKILLSFFVAMFSLGSVSAFACSCRDGSTADFFENADVVATGKVLSVRKKKGGEIPSLIVTVAAKTIWKGDAEEKIELTTADSSTACGFPFEKKKEYLLFLHRDDGTDLITSLCSGNGLVAKSKEAIDWLNKNHPVD